MRKEFRVDALYTPYAGGGLGPLTFCPAPPQFFHQLLIIAPPHTELGGPPPRVFWLEPPLLRCRRQYADLW